MGPASPDLRTRIEHALDARSVPLAVWLYRLTRGRMTRPWGRRAIVLTTTGRRTALPRTVIVQAFSATPAPADRRPDGPRAVVVVAANGGMPRPPGWYFNLKARPHTVVELEGTTCPARAEELVGDEAERTWSRVLETAPDYRRYETRIGRVPPMFRLTLSPPLRSRRSSEP